MFAFKPSKQGQASFFPPQKNLSMRRNASFVKMLPQLLKFYFLSSIQKIKPICWGANLSMSRRFRDIFVASKDFLLKLLIHKNHGFWEFSVVRNWIMAQKFNRRRLAADGGYLKWKKGCQTTVLSFNQTSSLETSVDQCWSKVCGVIFEINRKFSNL